jgi:transposase
VVWSVAEKNGMQAKSRINPTKAAIPGKAVRREFEYLRNGTAVLSVGLDVHFGQVADLVTDASRSENFVAFLTDLDRYNPTGLDLHCFLDNLSAHDTPLVEKFLDDHPRIFIHSTPTYASWLNQVEPFIPIIQRRLLSNGEFDSVDDLADRIIEFIKHHNKAARAFRLIYAG